MVIPKANGGGRKTAIALTDRLLLSSSDRAPLGLNSESLP